MSIQTELVVPLDIRTNNIIICRRRQNLEQISEKIRVDVDTNRQSNVKWLESNKIYGFMTKDKGWRRCMLKFTRPDNVQVLQLIDDFGVFDLRPYTQVREIEDSYLQQLPFGLIKVFIYGICYTPGKEFHLIFDGLVKDQEVQCVFGRIPEDNPNRIYQAYAADFLYEFNGKLHSFREALIREKVVSPARFDLSLNQRLFNIRTQRMAVQNSIFTGASIQSMADHNRLEAHIGDRFEILDLIGEGAYGAVSRSLDKRTNKEVAIKQYKNVLFGFNIAAQEHIKEAEILSKLNHMNIIDLIDIINENGVVGLVLPYMAYDLSSEICSTAYEKPRCKEVMCMVFAGIKHMHSRKIMHRDLKPDNILVAADGTIKICDLGFATEYKDDEFFMTVCGTHSYMSAEIFLKYGYNQTVDIWAAGCVFAEMKLRHRLVKSEFQKEWNIINIFGTPRDWRANDFLGRYGDKPSRLKEILGDDLVFLNIFMKIMKYDPAQRPSAANALELFQSEF